MSDRPLSDRLHGTEQERVERVKERYREERTKRLGQQRRWVPMAELYLPLPASAVGAILEALADVADGVTVRTNPANERIWYIGRWSEPQSDLVSVPTALAPGQFDQDDPARP